MQMLVSAGLIALVVVWGLLAPASLGAVFNEALAAITRNFGWFYLWVVLGLVVMALILAFSRYGDLKLGQEDDEPEFSIGAWFAMLFAAGMGIGLVFWGVAEPISHYGTPPPGIAPNTPEAANAAMRYSFFHWGLHPWAVYSIVALAIAFFQFRRGICQKIRSRVYQIFPTAEAPRHAAGLQARVVSGADVHIAVSHHQRLLRPGVQLFQNPAGHAGVRLYRCAGKIPPDHLKNTGEVVGYDHLTEFVRLVGADRQPHSGALQLFQQLRYPGIGCGQFHIASAVVPVELRKGPFQRLRLLRLTAAAGEQAERQKAHPQHDANHHAPTVSTLHLSRASYFPFSCESCFFSLIWPKHG